MEETVPTELKRDNPDEKLVFSLKLDKKWPLPPGASGSTAQEDENGEEEEEEEGEEEEEEGEEGPSAEEGSQSGEKSEEKSEDKWKSEKKEEKSDQQRDAKRPAPVKPAPELKKIFSADDDDAPRSASPPPPSAPSGHSKEDVGQKRKLTALEEIRLQEELKKEKRNRTDYWLDTGIVVKVMNKSLCDGKYYKKKGMHLLSLCCSNRLSPLFTPLQAWWRKF